MTKLQGFSFAFILIIFGSIFFISKRKANAKREKINKEYPPLLTSDEVDGLIDYKFNPKSINFRIHPSWTNISVDGKKMTISAFAVNNDNDAYYAGNVGDRILKKPNSDTIIIHKKLSKDSIVLLLSH